MSKKHNIDAAGQVHIAPVQNDRAIFEQARDAIADVISYAAHDIIPDIRMHVVEQAWFGHAVTKSPEAIPQESRSIDDMWRMGASITIDIDTSPDRSPEQAGITHDLDR